MRDRISSRCLAWVQEHELDPTAHPIKELQISSFPEPPGAQYVPQPPVGTPRDPHIAAFLRNVDTPSLNGKSASSTTTSVLYDATTAPTMNEACREAPANNLWYLQQCHLRGGANRSRGRSRVSRSSSTETISPASPSSSIQGRPPLYRYGNSTPANTTNHTSRGNDPAASNTLFDNIGLSRFDWPAARCRNRFAKAGKEKSWRLSPRNTSTSRTHHTSPESAHSPTTAQLPRTIYCKRVPLPRTSQRQSLEGVSQFRTPTRLSNIHLATPSLLSEGAMSAWANNDERTTLYAGSAIPRRQSQRVQPYPPAMLSGHAYGTQTPRSSGINTNHADRSGNTSKIGSSCCCLRGGSHTSSRRVRLFQASGKTIEAPVLHTTVSATPYIPKSGHRKRLLYQMVMPETQVCLLEQIKDAVDHDLPSLRGGCCNFCSQCKRSEETHHAPPAMKPFRNNPMQRQEKIFKKAYAQTNAIELRNFQQQEPIRKLPYTRMDSKGANSVNSAQPPNPPLTAKVALDTRGGTRRALVPYPQSLLEGYNDRHEPFNEYDDIIAWLKAIELTGTNYPCTAPGNWKFQGRFKCLSDPKPRRRCKGLYTINPFALVYQNRHWVWKYKSSPEWSPSLAESICPCLAANKGCLIHSQKHSTVRGTAPSPRSRVPRLRGGQGEEETCDCPGGYENCSAHNPNSLPGSEGFPSQAPRPRLYHTLGSACGVYGSSSSAPSTVYELYDLPTSQSSMSSRPHSPPQDLPSSGIYASVQIPLSSLDRLDEPHTRLTDTEGHFEGEKMLSAVGWNCIPGQQCAADDLRVEEFVVVLPYRNTCTEI